MAEFLVGYPQEHEQRMFDYLEGVGNFITWGVAQDKRNVSVNQINKYVYARRELGEGWSNFFNFLDKCSQTFNDLQYKKINLSRLVVGKKKKWNEEDIVIGYTNIIKQSVEGLENLVKDTQGNKEIIVQVVPNEITYGADW